MNMPEDDIIQIKNYYTKNGKIKYITEILEKLDLKSLSKFDFIFAGEIIEHIKNTYILLSLIKELLNIEGRGYCGYFTITTSDNIGGSHPQHFRQYNYQSLSKELERYFTITEMTHFYGYNNSWLFLIARGKR
jgi:hypothetical protein